MRMQTVLTLVVLCGASIVEAQPAVPSGLDEQIAFALRSNPDVLLAEAKVRQAQAELNAARLKVTQQVLGSHFEREKQEKVVQHMEIRLEAAVQKVKTGIVSADEAEAAKIALIEAKVALEQSAAQQRYLLGVGSLSSLAPAADVREARPVVTASRPAAPEALRAQLDRAVGLEGIGETPIELRELLLQLKKLSGVNFVLDRLWAENDQLMLHSLPSDLPLRSLLLAMADQAPGLCFVVRDYGILVTATERAWSLPGATIPAEVPLKLDE